MLSLLASLRLDVRLGTALAGLALIVNLAVFFLLGTVTGDGSANAAQGSLRAVRVALAQVLQLALGLLGLAALVLLRARLTQVLASDHITGELFGGTDSLVPFAGGAVLVVLHGGAGVGVRGEGAKFGGSVRGFVLSLGLVLGGFTLGL